MKDKEKQIEEIMYEVYKGLREHFYREESEQACKPIAEYLYSQNIRKLTKDSVVLSKEEYGSKLQDAYDNGLKWGTEWGSKETAEEILNLIKIFCSDYEFIEIIKNVITKEFGLDKTKE